MLGDLWFYLNSLRPHLGRGLVLWGAMPALPRRIRCSAVDVGQDEGHRPPEHLARLAVDQRLEKRGPGYGEVWVPHVGRGFAP